MTTWHVYQFRSDTELLYVGYTRHLNKRIAQHRLQKSWWPEVTDIQSEEFGTEAEARQREKEVWAGERPKHNKLNPFPTDEELQQSNRERSRRGRQSAKGRARQWKYNRTPIRRQRQREAARGAASGAGRRWQQTGPGLF